MIGALRSGNSFEVSVLFSEPVHQGSLLSLSSYSVSAGQLVSSALIATNRGALLTASDVAAAGDISFAVTGVTTPDEMPITGTNVTLTASTPQRVTVGASELGLPSSAFAVGTDGFDVFSSGYQQTGDYDELTFVAETISGDFDRWVRVEHVQPSSSPARVGLMVREFLDAGKPRPLDPESVEQGFSRYLEVAINPPTTATGAAGQNQHEIVQRAYHGGIGRTESQITRRLPIENNAAPEFPDAWLRIKRVGQSFELYRGTNTVNWILLGTATFPQPMPETLFVGPAFSPVNGSLPVEHRRTYLAKFREYSGADSEPLELKIERIAAGQFELSWTGEGILQQAPEVTGQWETAPSQANPQAVDIQQPKRFFRLISGQP